MTTIFPTTDDPGPAIPPAMHPSRALDWWCAGMIIAWGLVFAMPGDTFITSAAFTIVGQRLAENTWAVLLISLGAVRMVALIINGRLPTGSPAMRAGAAAIGVVLWAHFLEAFIEQSVRLGALSIGVATATAMLAADLFTTYRAARDITKARKNVHGG